MTKDSFFSHGKLLLTSEYFVLDGAKALALPTKLGQTLAVEEGSQRSLIHWKTFREGNLWLDATIDYEHEIVLTANLPTAAEFIASLLRTMKRMNSPKLQTSSSYNLVSNIQFPEDFGLGSSSTLINNLATWGKVDPFVLNETVLGGSGYDIAVAQQGHSICYTKQNEERIIEKVNFQSSYKNDLIFIHLNKKQNTRAGIEMYRSRPKNKELIREFSKLTDEVLKCRSLENFSLLMQEHEAIMSNFLKIETIGDKYFKDCPRFVKSLGAWGGDFVLSAKFENYESYFSSRNFHKVFTFDDLIY